MKKPLYSLLALAALSLASCQPDKLLGGSAGEDGAPATITLSVTLGPQTKAFADGSQANQLYAGLYQIGGTQQEPTFTHVAHKEDPIAINSKTASVSFEGQIHRGNDYRVVLWAQKNGAPYAIDWATAVTTGPTVTVTETGAANDENRDAFYGFFDALNVQGVVNADVQLKRPFAQVNILVPNVNINDVNGEVRSTMTVAQAPTVLNLATRATSVPANWSFTEAVIGEAAFGKYSASHKYVGMNYVLVPQDAGGNYTVGFTVSASGGNQLSGAKALDNTPLRPNSRSNLAGNVFAEDFNMNVNITVVPALGQVATPTFSPVAGSYDVAQNVTISCTTDGAVIHYTTDGTDPTDQSAVYSTPIAVSETTTLKAIAVCGGAYDSEVASATFTIGGQAPAPSVVYTLTPTNGTNSSYADNCDITIDGITWNLTGNSQMSPWRIGGKSLDNQDRELYSKTAIIQDISSIEVTHGEASGITVNSVKLIVASDSSFETVVSEITKNDFAANSTMTFERPGGKSWANCYYKFVYNVTVSVSSNKFVSFTSAEFTGI